MGPDLAIPLVLLSALMHAAWNAVLKIQGERILVLTLIMFMCALIGALAIPFLPPPDRASWPFLAGSTAVHVVYAYSLCAAYEREDLSLAYPIARGCAPGMVLCGSLLFLSDPLSGGQLAGVLIIAAGILLLALYKLRDAHSLGGIGFALLTALSIAVYSTLDGVGGRRAGNVHSYAAWLFLVQFLPLGLVVYLTRRDDALAMLRRNWRPGLLGGSVATASYWIAIWAMSVAPIAVVVALRETSVVFAIAIGVLFLGERLTRLRLVATLVVLAGIVVLRLG